ncbi:HK97 gp10 family phage protein [Pseudobacillus wudalianchiensis]|uniref:Phage portal protein n=1 Tax=Pseudobacillus wudalianchiensis TaxID=1743143 RepID=A0A1B9AN84_9BACI|nr:HK97 gp10 family phage protein [Bacillus wudalianchiensis]OCA85231.1 phage portal protein [Bacillus wudalianchiensis]
MSLKILGLKQFIKQVEKATDGGLKREFGLWLEGLGMDFLGLIQDEIIRTETVDTRRLLNSFNRGDSEGIWSISEGGLTLEIGTRLAYASYANDGHFQQKRFVPGYWRGDRFVYEPGASTGMMLREKWVEGSHYWDNALAIFERIFQRSLERRMQQWLDTEF